MHETSEVFGYLFKFIDKSALALTRICCAFKAMVEVVVNKCPLRIGDGGFDRLQLLCEIKAGPSLLDHLDNTSKVTCGTLQSFDDGGMGFV